MAVVQDTNQAIICIWQPRGHTGAGLVDEAGTFGWCELAVPDVRRADAFYTSVFDVGGRSRRRAPRPS